MTHAEKKRVRESREFDADSEAELKGRFVASPVKFRLEEYLNEIHQPLRLEEGADEPIG